MELVFLIDYSPRSKGEVAVFETHQELKVAEWYIANGIAKEKCKCDENTAKKCSECEEQAKQPEEQAKQNKKK